MKLKPKKNTLILSFINSFKKSVRAKIHVSDGTFVAVLKKKGFVSGLSKKHAGSSLVSSSLIKILIIELICFEPCKSFEHKHRALVLFYTILSLFVTNAPYYNTAGDNE